MEEASLKAIAKWMNASITFQDIKLILKVYLMNRYDIKPSLADKCVEEMFLKAINIISLDMQEESKDEEKDDLSNYSDGFIGS